MLLLRRNHEICSMHPQHIEIKDYSYLLPNERIAKYPLAERDLSKLLIYRNGNISETIYRDIGSQLQSDTLLIFNNTKVIEARIFFEKETGGTIEIFCLEPAHGKHIAEGMCSRGKVYWNCLVGGVSKWKGEVLEKKIQTAASELVLFAEMIEKTEDAYVIAFSWHAAELAFGEVLHAAGIIPLPPYLKRETEEKDAETYQTVYAKVEGSVAAPTAGLHFTTPLLASLQQKGIRHEFVTLHVGAGTFKPVKSEKIGDHTMHSEWIQVQLHTIENILNLHPKDVIPVGTTSLRTLETLYWMGVKAFQHPDATLETLEIKQWDVYDLASETVTVEQALQALISWINDRRLSELVCQTQLLMAPGYRVKIADALITNFHQPNSTLLLLVAALIGDDWRKVYDYALAHDFRFLSYGDGSLLWVNK